MAAKIVWSQNALDDLEKVKEYLEKEQVRESADVIFG